MQSCDVTSRPVAIFSGKAVTVLEQSQVYLKLRPRRQVSFGKCVTKSVPTHSVTGQQRDSEKLRQAMDERRRIVCERTIRSCVTEQSDIGFRVEKNQEALRVAMKPL